MTTLTLDQAKTIIFSASNADDALAALLDAGSDVIYHDAQCFSVHCGDLDIISFTQLPHSKFMSVAVGVHFFSLEQRKAFLESQQQNTSMVPANEQTPPSVGTVACAAEARPESTDDLCQDLMGFFTILGKVANFDESWQRTFYENLLSNSYIPVASPFDANLRLILTVIADTHDQLSTRPLEVNCFCPACDYDLATATKDHDSDFYHVNCTVCSLDRDFDSIQLSTESVDKVGE